jgi:hypothetical protein
MTRALILAAILAITLSSCAAGNCERGHLTCGVN